jgi:hypothetical protein
MRIRYKNTKDKNEAYKKAKKIINKKYLAKWNLAVEVNCDDDLDKISADGKGFEMEIKFHDTHCKVELKLSFLLRAFQSKIETIIKEELEKNV